MASMRIRIRRDDEVVVISGKDRGQDRQGPARRSEESRVFVEGLNIIKRHQRPTQAQASTAPRRSAA